MNGSNAASVGMADTESKIGQRIHRAQELTEWANECRVVSMEIADRMLGAEAPRDDRVEPGIEAPSEGVLGALDHSLNALQAQLEQCRQHLSRLQSL